MSNIMKGLVLSNKEGYEKMEKTIINLTKHPVVVINDEGIEIAKYEAPETPLRLNSVTIVTDITN